jgi:hypothetical protein
MLTAMRRGQAGLAEKITFMQFLSRKGIGAVQLPIFPEIEAQGAGWMGMPKG